MGRDFATWQRRKVELLMSVFAVLRQISSAFRAIGVQANAGIGADGAAGDVSISSI
ncbi:hypothetical protein [Burkholderia sp. Ac-20365]|uniref:hypothetical protein n=1 Tax=Burkholderia sp. Ac-20365 TaxID=2703897 RepID=UPI00197C4464|nr:hypothetical protein [Burkholderia sp. Ac-20365]MBN3764902.1 hypothetical protein [Burkholderia sp. Ac-20365]